MLRFLFIVLCSFFLTPGSCGGGDGEAPPAPPAVQSVERSIEPEPVWASPYNPTVMMKTKKKFYEFGETAPQDLLMLPVVSDLSVDRDACTDRDFLVTLLSQPHTLLSCDQEDGVAYDMKISSCIAEKLSLKTFVFVIEIPSIMGSEDVERKLFDGTDTETTRLQDFRLCDADDSELCLYAMIDRIDSQRGKVVFVADQSSVFTVDASRPRHLLLKVMRPCDADHRVTSLLKLNVHLSEVIGHTEKAEEGVGVVGAIIAPHDSQTADRQVTISHLP